MKSTFICLLMVLGFLGAHYFGVFAFFTQKSVLWTAFGLIAVLFAVGYGVIGNKNIKRKRPKK